MDGTWQDSEQATLRNFNRTSVAVTATVGPSIRAQRTRSASRGLERARVASDVSPLVDAGRRVRVRVRSPPGPHSPGGAARRRRERSPKSPAAETVGDWMRLGLGVLVRGLQGRHEAAFERRSPGRVALAQSPPQPEVEAGRRKQRRRRLGPGSPEAGAPSPAYGAGRTILVGGSWAGNRAAEGLVFLGFLFLFFLDPRVVVRAFPVNRLDPLPFCSSTLEGI